LQWVLNDQPSPDVQKNHQACKKKGSRERNPKPPRVSLLGLKNAAKQKTAHDRAS